VVLTLPWPASFWTVRKGLTLAQFVMYGRRKSWQVRLGSPPGDGQVECPLKCTDVSADRAAGEPGGHNGIRVARRDLVNSRL
jgi:hypothetical protein